MTPIVAFAHCVRGIKLPLLSSQLPASNTARLLGGDVPPPVLPSSPFLHLSPFLCVIHPLISIVYLCPFGLSHSLLFLQLPLLSSPLKIINLLFGAQAVQWEGCRRAFNKRGVGKEVSGWNDTSSQSKPKTKVEEMNWHIWLRGMTHFSWLLFNAWVIFELPLELIYNC